MAALSVWAVGWLSMLLFGPLLGIVGIVLVVSWIVLLYFWIQPGDRGDNAYGPPPPVFDPTTRPA